ncbi:MAG: UdgX family uracil-DNA binding protein [Woeseiaceae bacterium]|nr:UdgX family uracil-DNA binding protein [Woeseiaceae bacterium]
MSAPVSVTLDEPANYSEWRAAARRLLTADVSPDQVGFRLATNSGDLFDTQAGRITSQAASAPVRVPRDFPKLAKEVICHNDDSRFALLYRLLWRLRTERRLLDNAADSDVYAARQMAKAVRRETHKMKAFVRFRRAESDVGEVFVAWFEPDHHIVERAAPFFARRFAGMRWSIVTPCRAAHWDGERLSFGDGASRLECPDGDALEEHWRIYYASIFNPARMKVRAMKAEMPTRYWRNLPESRLIPELTRSAQRAQRAAPAGTAPSVHKARQLVAQQESAFAEIHSTPQTLEELTTGLQQCTRCDLCHKATAAVAGEGAPGARLMIVGEQPGDHEDLAGRPFVGPAGQVLDEALVEAGIKRDAVFLTNAVKHFKHRLRGKRRIHERPNANEVEVCRWWLGLEIDIIKPSVVVALGATAARALLGHAVKISDIRGRPIRIADGTVIVATVHPAYLLRLPDRERVCDERSRFIEELHAAAQLSTATG